MSYNLSVGTTALYVSGEFEYKLTSGDALYYGDSPNVSASNKIGTLAVGDTLGRSNPSYIVSAGTSYVSQQARSTPSGASVVDPIDGGSPTYDLASRSFRMKTGANYVNVRNFGATGDGVTDDTAAVQAAINTAEAAGGGRVVFPLGTYYGGTVRHRPDEIDPATWIGWVWQVVGDNIELYFEPGAKLYTDQIGSLIFAGGWGKRTGDMMDWKETMLGRAVNATTYPYRAMSAAAKGDRSVTVTTPAQAADFAVGDRVHIRTGQTVDGASQVSEPDAELNEVTSVDVGTGVVGLRYPLSKSYAQEYFISETGGYTSTSVTANLAAFGIAKVTDRVVKNLKITNCTFESTAMEHSSTFKLYACDGLEVTGLRGTTKCAIVDNIENRAVRFSKWRVASNPSVSGGHRWAFAFGTTCVDGIVDDVRAQGIGSRMLIFHIHEGSAQVTIKNSRISSPLGTNDMNAISIRGRSYDLMLRDCVVDTKSTALPAVLASALCVTGGEIRNLQVTGGSKAVGVDAVPNLWTVRNVTPVVGTVASAAALTLPPGEEIVAVTGTTSVTSMTADRAGKRVTLVFAAALTFTDGNNLKLAGNFVTTADDTITLICDGTNWYEIARSAN